MGSCLIPPLHPSRNPGAQPPSTLRGSVDSLLPSWPAPLTCRLAQGCGSHGDRPGSPCSPAWDLEQVTTRERPAVRTGTRELIPDSCSKYRYWFSPEHFVHDRQETPDPSGDDGDDALHPSLQGPSLQSSEAALSGCVDGNVIRAGSLTRRYLLGLPGPAPTSGCGSRSSRRPAPVARVTPSPHRVEIQLP